MWNVQVRGVVRQKIRESFRSRLLLRLLKRLMKADDQQMAGDLFCGRIAPFLAPGDRGRRIAVQFGSRIHVLSSASKRSGHFAGVLRLSAEEMQHAEDAGQAQDGWLQFAAMTTSGDEQLTAPCQAQILPCQGISVVSDIDDTIKHSDVTHRRQLLVNTFLRPFAAVAGMAELYRNWGARQAAFHFVSSSPWQLFEPLADLCHEAGFPAGSFHLRALLLRDPTVLRLFIARRWGKLRVIRSLLKVFPQRKFVLVGDSGEKDPELYGLLARRFARQVARVFIRDLPDWPVTGKRAGKVFRGLPVEKWLVFRDPAEIADLLPQAGESR